MASRIDMEENPYHMLEKLDYILELVRDVKRIESQEEGWDINNVPNDDVRDSKIVEVDIVHNDTDVEASVESSPPIPDDIPCPWE